MYIEGTKQLITVGVSFGHLCQVPHCDVTFSHLHTLRLVQEEVTEESTIQERGVSSFAADGWLHVHISPWNSPA